MNERAKARKEFYRKKYYQKYGKPRKPPHDSFRRTEGDVQFIYNKEISNLYIYWATNKRNNGVTPVFTDFYNQLSDEQKTLVQVTNIK